MAVLNSFDGWNVVCFAFGEFALDIRIYQSGGIMPLAACHIPIVLLFGACLIFRNGSTMPNNFIDVVEQHQIDCHVMMQFAAVIYIYIYIYM